VEEGESIAKYYAKAFDFDWRTGMRPHVVEAVLSELPQEAPSAEEQVHPADLI
jgi:hypothetical protein